MVAALDVGRRAQLQREAGEPGLVQHPDRQDEHDDIDHRAAEIDEAADPFHSAQEDHELEEPHEQEAEPRQRGQADDAVVGEVDRRGHERDDEHLDGFGGEVGLYAIPDDADHAAHDGREVGAHDAEGNAGHDRERNAVAQRRAPDQVHEKVDGRYADQHGDEHLPSRQAQKEQARRESIAADRVDVGHPHGEEAEGAPGPALGRGWREVMVIELRVGARDHERWNFTFG